MKLHPADQNHHPGEGFVSFAIFAQVHLLHMLGESLYSLCSVVAIAGIYLMIQTRYPGRPSFNLRLDSHLERSQMSQFASYRKFLEWPNRSNFGGLAISQTGSTGSTGSWAIRHGICGCLPSLLCLCLFS